MVKEIEITSEVKNFKKVELFLENIGLMPVVSKKLYGRIYVSISELVNNAIAHGNQYDKSKKVKISFIEHPQAYIFSVEDEGNGFCLSDLPNPLLANTICCESGRGIFIVKQFSNKMESFNNGRIIKVTFYKEK